MQSMLKQQLQLDIVFSVTYYLELYNVVSITCVSHNLQINIQVGCVNIIETSMT